MLWRSSMLVSPLECADTKKWLASSLESAVTKLLDLKSLRMNRYRKTTGGSFDKERRRQAAVHGRKWPDCLIRSHKVYLH